VSGSLQVAGVRLSFGALSVLDDVSFEVQPGTVHGLIGPNGAGKSSCFNVICGLYTPTSGRVVLDGTDLTNLRPHLRVAAGIGRSFQNTALTATRTVFDNLRLARHSLNHSGVLGDGLRLPKARRERKADETRLLEIAHFLQLTDVLDVLTGTLPYGIQKRVDMARAVATEPRVLLLDEPAAGMGPSETGTIAAAVQAINSSLGISVLVVEHDMGFVMGVCDAITVLNFGRLIAEGTPEQIRTNAEVVHSYLGSAFDSIEDVVEDLAAEEVPS